ncbi:MAG TPA: BON domain-containing protein [Candidatus Sulfotelmatobacter sp.]|nr:BON domain-containing protein [Candidatus Sulfotelmatobacter sp.]
MTRDFTFRALSVGLGACALTLGIGMAPARAASLHTALPQADNTAANKQAGATADQQKNDAADRELAQKIRQSINGDKSLSTDAHNVKVIVRNGHVTLKGPVTSEQEKQNIEDKASDLAGPDKVTNKLTVKS